MNEKKKLSGKKIAAYIGIFIGVILLLVILFVLLFPGVVVNNILKDKIHQEFSRAVPGYHFNFHELDISPFGTSVKTDSLNITSEDSSEIYAAGNVSISNVSWSSILFNNSASDILSDVEVSGSNASVSLHESKNRISAGEFELSIPAKSFAAKNIKFYPLLSDKDFFARSKFRLSRFIFSAASLELENADFISMFSGNGFFIENIKIESLSANIFINKDKPFDPEARPKMPNEIFQTIDKKIKISSVNITNGLLHLYERYDIEKRPAFLEINKIKLGISNIENKKANTTKINGSGMFMKVSPMKLNMNIPLNSKEFDMNYSGSFGQMDAKVINSFLEISENQRIKSGELVSAGFSITVNNGTANGVLDIHYKDLSLAVLDEKSGSEKKLVDKIKSWIGNTFIVKGDNIPGDDMKQGQIHYVRTPDNYFMQYVWFAFRNGLADVVGFKKNAAPK